MAEIIEMAGKTEKKLSGAAFLRLPARPRWLLLFMLSILLSASLAAAVDVSTDKEDYSSGERVTVEISSCAGISVLKFFNPKNELVDIKSGEGNWSAEYQTSSDPAAGKYNAAASCSNGNAQANFCVDDPGCLEELADDACVPEWECGDWSGCGADGEEERTCTDKNNCELGREETRSCTYVCQESWTCLDWSTCVNGIQTRTCYDQNNCGSSLQKPLQQQTCQAFVEQPLAKKTAPAEKEGSFFSENLGLIVAVVLAAVLLVAGLWYYFRWKGKEASLEEVREWISSERDKGVSDEDISLSLEKRGWEEKDIKAAMK